MSSRMAVAAIVLLIPAFPALGADEARPADRNYRIVFHTTLAGESETVAVNLSEGNFHVRTPEPDIAVTGMLEVTEDLTHRLNYQFRHDLDGAEGESSNYYERSGWVVLEPDETVTVVDAPNVKLGIELRAER